MIARPSSPRSGFSLLEIVIAISVLAILAGVMTLRSGTVIDTIPVTCRTHDADGVMTNLLIHCHVRNRLL